LTFRLIKIDDALRREHHYLTADDECYCLGEYFPGEGYKAGPVNSMISNFKKPVTKRHLAEYRHKENDIVRAGRLVREVLGPDAPNKFTLVPIPPSKAKADPLYDDRLVRVLRTGQPVLDVRELLVTIESTRAHHEFAEGEKRPTPDELYELLAIDEAPMQPALKPTVIVFDDVLTNGTHFKACKRKILERSPQTRVIGLFIGRRKLPPTEEVDFDSIFGPDV
jgi:predicted amidophosphoribosyltransferase